MVQVLTGRDPRLVALAPIAGLPLPFLQPVLAAWLFAPCLRAIPGFALGDFGCGVHERAVVDGKLAKVLEGCDQERHHRLRGGHDQEQTAVKQGKNDGLEFLLDCPRACAHRLDGDDAQTYVSGGSKVPL